jgi:SAM-dependent methyltransferase
VPSERRLAFGGVAELYDASRPSYPEALVEDVMAFAGVAAGDRALEVGAGTGKATIPFADRGLRVLALEPSDEMARLLRANTAGRGNVVVEETEFESWQLTGAVRLLYSAQAWHWIAPAFRYARAAQALGPGGALAVFWNRPRWEGCPLREELAEAYLRAAPDFGPEVGPGPMHPAAGISQRWWADWKQELEEAPGFTGAEVRTYSWQQRYTTDAYVRLLQTHSDHIVLEEPVRRALLDAVAVVIDSHGGVLELEHATILAMARHTSSRSEARG